MCFHSIQLQHRIDHVAGYAFASFVYGDDAVFPVFAAFLSGEGGFALDGECDDAPMQVHNSKLRICNTLLHSCNGSMVACIDSMHACIAGDEARFSVKIDSISRDEDAKMAHFTPQTTTRKPRKAQTIKAIICRGNNAQYRG